MLHALQMTLATKTTHVDCELGAQLWACEQKTCYVVQRIFSLLSLGHRGRLFNAGRELFEILRLVEDFDTQLECCSSVIISTFLIIWPDDTKHIPTNFEVMYDWCWLCNQLWSIFLHIFSISLVLNLFSCDRRPHTAKGCNSAAQLGGFSGRTLKKAMTMWSSRAIYKRPRPPMSFCVHLWQRRTTVRCC